MAITKAQEVTTTTYTASFNGVSHLVVFRQAPFRFTLASPNSVTTPFVTYINDDYSNQGSIDLIEYIKTLALDQQEEWSESQQLHASLAQTIYIVHDGFNDIKLNQEEKVVDKEYLEMLNPGTTIFLSHDCTAFGLEALVDELLAWMATQTV